MTNEDSGEPKCKCCPKEPACEGIQFCRTCRCSHCGGTGEVWQSDGKGKTKRVRCTTGLCNGSGCRFRKTEGGWQIEVAD